MRRGPRVPKGAVDHDRRDTVCKELAPKQLGFRTQPYGQYTRVPQSNWPLSWRKGS